MCADVLFEVDVRFRLLHAAVSEPEHLLGTFDHLDRTDITKELGPAKVNPLEGLQGAHTLRGPIVEDSVALSIRCSHFGHQGRDSCRHGVIVLEDVEAAELVGVVDLFHHVDLPTAFSSGALHLIRAGAEVVALFATDEAS